MPVVDEETLLDPVPGMVLPDVLGMLLDPLPDEEAGTVDEDML